MIRLFSLLSGLFFALCVPASAQEGARILAIGDSLMAWHEAAGQSIADVVAERLGEPVANRSVSGAKIIHALPITGALGMRIDSQFQPKGWDWVIMTGGGNDLVFGCGCGACERRMERMIDANGTRGKIPELIARIRATGARVVYIGYLRSPGVGSMIDACLPMGNTLEARIAAMAERDAGVTFLSLATLTPNGDRSMHGVDMIHPSVKASRVIGMQVAQIIQKADKTR
ncbi:SGNH/GDSL hydrolase family protein [Celeribacter sp.]|uniref:SGNH/GDSL hydrolase family protein n=1 Tax=Celeribacter sp. TaxID=1890673 RepID=UPI003A937FDB